MAAPSAPSRPRHFGGGPTSLADVVRPREVVAAPAVRVKVDRIDPSPRNPRRTMDVAELVQSIAAYGLLQPVVLRRTGARYELIAGHRRLAAVKLLGERYPSDPRWREIDAVLRDADPDQGLILTLVENLQREDLDPREEAAALEVLVREHGYSTRKVGEAIHRGPMYVSRRLRVFEDPALAGPVLVNQMTVSLAEELLVVKEPQLRSALAERAIAEGWGHQEARRAAAEANCIGPIHARAAAPLRQLRRVVAVLETAAPLADGDHAEVARLVARLQTLVSH